MNNYFVPRVLQTVFQSDAMETSTPMNLYIEHTDSVDSVFSLMTSDKGNDITSFVRYNFANHSIFSRLCASDVYECIDGSNFFKRPTILLERQVS